jgi:hypothetical protein
MDGDSPRLPAFLTRTVAGVPLVVPLVAVVAIVAILGVYLVASPPAPAVVRSPAAPPTGRALPTADQPPDPCTLLNIREVAFAFGVGLTGQRSNLAMVDGAGRQCTWSTATAPYAAVSLVIVTATSAQASRGVTIDESYAGASGGLTDEQDLAGLGKTARYSPGKRALYVELPTAWFALTATGAGISATKMQTALLGAAKTVLSRYPH